MAKKLLAIGWDDISIIFGELYQLGNFSVK